MFYLFWESVVFALVEHLLPIRSKSDAVSRTSLNHSVSVQWFWNIFAISIRKDLAHVDNVVMDKISPPPFNLITFCLVICTNSHKSKVWEVVTVYID